jgi:hypothetical protein
MKSLSKVAVLFVACAAPVAFAKTSSVGVSDVLKAPRPKHAEYFGLYLLNKKVGYVSTTIGIDPMSKNRVRATNELFFRANVGPNTSERRYREVRVYEAEPGGRLISFLAENHGDGGDQTLEGKAKANGFEVVRKRPGQPNQIFHVSLPKETVEDTDQVRVALLRQRSIEGDVLDGMDLETYKLSTRLEGSERRLVKGVKVTVHKLTSISSKEKVPVDSYVTDDGVVVEINFNQTMKAVAEPEAVAKRLDEVEVFALTRVVLPHPLPPSAQRVPGSVQLVLSGLAPQFAKETYRQSFQKVDGERTQVTISAAPPNPEKLKQRPLADPAGGEYLKSTLLVEANDPKIRATARKIIGEETNAYPAAKQIVDWTGRNMKKAYGASLDRASDVLRQMKGDCTEHSLLAVALLRSVGIPAKRVDGLVYLVNDDGVPAFYWHEWIEAYVGEWTQMDPTFNQSVADATHLALGEEGHAEITPLIGQLKAVAVK